MSQTRRRSAEATFFHEKFVDAVGLAPPLKEGAGYDLDAFVASARSIPWIMRWEYSAVPGSEDWFKSVPVTEKEFDVLDPDGYVLCFAEDVGA